MSVMSSSLMQTIIISKVYYTVKAKCYNDDNNNEHIASRDSDKKKLESVSNTFQQLKCDEIRKIRTKLLE